VHGIVVVVVRLVVVGLVVVVVEIDVAIAIGSTTGLPVLLVREKRGGNNAEPMIQRSKEGEREKKRPVIQRSVDVASVPFAAEAKECGSKSECLRLQRPQGSDRHSRTDRSAGREGAWRRGGRRARGLERTPLSGLLLPKLTDGTECEPKVVATRTREALLPI
jgi:hypothetical protein